MDNNKPSLMLNEQLYLKAGIRIASQLMQAKSVDQNTFNLPKAAVYHYVDPLGATIGPAPSDTLFRAYPSKLSITYVQSYAPDYVSKAKYRTLPGLWDEKSPSAEIKHYHHVNKRMRRVVSFDQTLTDTNAPLIVSYARIPKHYEYMDNIYRKLYQFEDLYNNVFSKIQEINENKFLPELRQQFITIDVPGTLVPWSYIEQTLKSGITTVQQQKISTDAQRLMVHLFWIFSDKKQDSIFSKIKPQDAHKVTFLFTYAGKISILNYGMLLSMCESQDYDKLHHKKKQKMQPMQMRKYLYLMFMNIIGQSAEIDEGEHSSITDTSTTAVQAAVKLAEQDEEKQEISKETLAAIDEAISDSENIATVKVITTLDKQPPLESLQDAYTKQVQRAVASGAITSTKQITALTEQASKYQEIVLSDGKKFKDAVVVLPQDKLIKPKSIAKDITTIIDESITKTNVETIHQQYVSKVMRPHILSTIASVQRAGVMVEGIEEKDVSDITGENTQISVQLNPIVGKRSTVHMKIPKVYEDGTFKVNGVVYRLANQLTDAPIRKVSLDKVVLSSAYGRVFITKNDYSRNNYTNWICDGVMALAQDEKSKIKAVNIGDNTQAQLEHSKAVTALKTKYRMIQAGEFTFYFDEQLSKKAISSFPNTGHYWCGTLTKDKNQLIGLDKNDFVYGRSAKGEITPIAHIEDVLGLDRGTRPVQYAMLSTAGVEIPLGIAMSVIYGLDNLISLLKAEVRYIPRNMWSKEPISNDEWSLDFSDTKMVFKNSDTITELIMGGFTKYQKSIKEHDIEFFNKAGSIATMLSKTNMGSVADAQVRNIRFMDDMFVDPITQDILATMKEPTSFRGLLHRSAQLLSTGQFSREFMLEGQMRISGYERFSMSIYKELTNAIRMQSRAIARQNKPISLNPNAVWINITTDPAKTVVNDNNPIGLLKCSELLTFSGHGGRSKETMVASTRLYDPSYMGVVSEATVDSGDVGIRSYLSVNPDIKDIYGFTGNDPQMNPGNLYSTSALLFSSTDRDD